MKSTHNRKVNLKINTKTHVLLKYAVNSRDPRGSMQKTKCFFFSLLLLLFCLSKSKVRLEKNQITREKLSWEGLNVIAKRIIGIVMSIAISL